MPIGLSSVVGSGGHRRHFFGFCIRNSMPNLPFAGSRSNTYGEPTAAWIQPPSPIALRDEHQVLQLEERLVVGAQRVGKPDRRRILGVEPVAPRPPCAADDLIRDVRHDADQAREPRAPVEKAPGRNRCQSSTNSGRCPSSSDRRLMMTLMNCRVRSTIGRRIVVPGRFESCRFQMK